MGYSVSIIVVYNNKKKIKELNKHLKDQTIYNNVKKIFIDNTGNSYTSAASALNRGAACSHEKILIFMHQDVILLDKDIIEKYVKFLSNNPDSIIGVAGVEKNGKRTITDIYDSNDKLPIGIRANGEIYEVDSLDECLFAMTHERWNYLKFDEICCDNWHSYALDICFSNRVNDGHNYLVPAKVWHQSAGDSYNFAFYISIYKLFKKYRKTRIKIINGTCVYVRCTAFYFFLYTIKFIVYYVFLPIIKYKHKLRIKCVSPR